MYSSRQIDLVLYVLLFLESLICDFVRTARGVWIGSYIWMMVDWLLSFFFLKKTLLRAAVRRYSHTKSKPARPSLTKHQFLVALRQPLKLWWHPGRRLVLLVQPLCSQQLQIFEPLHLSVCRARTGQLGLLVATYDTHCIYIYTMAHK